MVKYQIVGLGGCLTQDVKVFNGTVAKFGVAVENGFGAKKKTAFINCVAFQNSFHEKVWELLTKLKKGANLGVEGKFTGDEYEKDNKKVYSTQLVVNAFNLFYSDAPKGENKGEGQAKEAPVPAAASAVKEDDDIPF